MNMKTIPELDWRRIDLLIALALEEDLQDRGDVTTKSVIGEHLRVKAVFLAKEDCVCAGLPVAKRIMKEVDPEIEWKDLAMKHCGLLIFPMSWYIAPTLASIGFAPTASAAASTN